MHGIRVIVINVFTDNVGTSCFTPDGAMKQAQFNYNNTTDAFKTSVNFAF